MTDLWQMTAVEAVARLKKREISPARPRSRLRPARIAEVEPAVNALPTLCLDRARDHAKRHHGGRRSLRSLRRSRLARRPSGVDQGPHRRRRRAHDLRLADLRQPRADQIAPVVERIERKGGIVVAKSNTPEFGAGGSTFNEVFGRTRNPWNTSLTCGGSTGGGAVSVATGEVWLAHGSDHGGSLRRPGTYCSVVGIAAFARPRDARHLGTISISPQSVQGPMARTVARPRAVPRHHGRASARTIP